MEKPQKCEIVCVDLDYTLISTDILIEQIIAFLKKYPLRFFVLFVWLFKSRRYLKKKLSECVEIDYSNLPFRKEILDFLLKEKEKQKKIVLVTASNQKIAVEINNRLKLFDEVYGSDQENSLKGKDKAKFLERKFGRGNFTYIGDSICDCSIWKISKESYLVSNSRFMQFLLKRFRNFSGNMLSYKTKFRDYLNLIRFHQWAKNLLLFFPLILAHEFQNLGALKNALLSFFSFSFIASSMYIINDIIDLEKDRNHPTKKFRPITNGTFSAYAGFIISLILLSLGFSLAFTINYLFVALTIAYLFLNLIYSFGAKKLAIFDIFTLSIFYVIRLYSGSVATHIPISNWLLAFSMFFFLSLATLKRYSEVKLSQVTENELLGRPYNKDSVNFIQTLGIGSSFASTVVFILYINSQKVMDLYQHPSLLWAVAFLLLLWMMLIWNFANRGKIDYDPVAEAMKNPFLISLELIMVTIWLTAIFL